MSPGVLRQLQTLCRSNGVQTTYVDMDGVRRESTPEVLVAVLGALGIVARGPRAIREGLRQTHAREWQECIPPILIAWNGQPTQIPIRLPAATARRSLRYELRLEDGTVLPLSRTVHRRRMPSETRVGNTRYVAQQLELPAVPLGYHSVEVEHSGGISRALLIAAPARAFSVPTRAWGAFLPMYAAHSEKSWGAGNFSDWRRLTQWIGSVGGGVAGTLPLLAAFLDAPVCEPSPYSPASRLFWNEFYLDIDGLPEFGHCPAAQRLVRSARFQRRLRRLRESALIDYRRAWALRREVLAVLARWFFENRPQQNGAFVEYLSRRPEARDYARFRAVCDATGEPWRRWPVRLREGRVRPDDCDPLQEQLHLWAQWRAQTQMDQLVQESRAEGMQFYLDLPLGVHPDGYDVWRERENFASGADAGAPPDMFFSKGQNWGFPPLHPRGLRERGYEYVRAFLRFHMRHTDLLRVDHVMGLHRLYWIPAGFPAAQGAYVSYPADEWYAILSLESHRHRTMLIGENLGTVPPEVNERVRQHGLRELFVLQYEQRPARNALRRPPAGCVASVNTHDVPAFAAHWRGSDILDRADLGLIPRNKLRDEREKRRRLNAALVLFLQRKGFLNTPRPAVHRVLDACLRWLARSPAGIVLVNLEDLWLEQSPQNVPGTGPERPNWRRRAKLSLRRVRLDARIRATLRRLQRARSEPPTPVREHNR